MCDKHKLLERGRSERACQRSVSLKDKETETLARQQPPPATHQDSLSIKPQSKSERREEGEGGEESCETTDTECSGESLAMELEETESCSKTIGMKTNGIFTEWRDE